MTGTWILLPLKSQVALFELRYKTNWNRFCKKMMTIIKVIITTTTIIIIIIIVSIMYVVVNRSSLQSHRHSSYGPCCMSCAGHPSHLSLHRENSALAGLNSFYLLYNPVMLSQIVLLVHVWLKVFIDIQISKILVVI